MLSVYYVLVLIYHNDRLEEEAVEALEATAEWPTVNDASRGSFIPNGR
jgi:hypothetical protein